MEHTQSGNQVKARPVDHSEFTEVDHLTEIVVYMPLVGTRDIYTHHVSTNLLERCAGKRASEAVRDLINDDFIKPLEAFIGAFHATGDWHRMTSRQQAKMAIATFDRLTLAVTSHHEVVA